MLLRYHERHDSNRALVGVDLSPRMAAISRDRLKDAADILVGDMRSLEGTASGTAAGLISFFALHHLGAQDIPAAFSEWKRVLTTSGRLALATWEGSGRIDYGDQSDLIAYRYNLEEVVAWAKNAGFENVIARVEKVDGLAMDAIYLNASVR